MLHYYYAMLLLYVFSDHQYNGNYINSDDSCNYKTAKGFNYHQGPVRAPFLMGLIAF